MTRSSRGGPLAGCGTISQLFKVGKVKVMKKVLNTPSKAELLMDLGKDQSIKEEIVQNAEFVRAMLYTRKQKETYIYSIQNSIVQKMQVKLSMCLPNDPESVEQVIIRVHH